jgi:uncharacterized protein YukE
MAKIDIKSINEMHESATSIREKCEQFKETANQLKAATDALTQDAEGWQSEASEIFNANITDAKRWMDEIAQVVVEFSTAIDDSAVKYVQTDAEAAKGFK